MEIKKQKKEKKRKRDNNEIIKNEEIDLKNTETETILENFYKFLDFNQLTNSLQNKLPFLHNLPFPC